MFTVYMVRGSKCVELDFLDLYQGYKQASVSTPFFDWLQENIKSIIENQDVWFSDYTDLVITWRGNRVFDRFIRYYDAKLQFIATNVDMALHAKATLSRLSESFDLNLFDNLACFIADYEQKTGHKVSTDIIDQYIIIHNCSAFGGDTPLLYGMFIKCQFFSLECDNNGEPVTKALLDWVRDEATQKDDLVDFEKAFFDFDTIESYAQYLLSEFYSSVSITDKNKIWFFNIA